MILGHRKLLQVFVQTTALEKRLHNRQEDVFASRMEGRPYRLVQARESGCGPRYRENLALPGQANGTGAGVDRYLDKVLAILLLGLEDALGRRHA